MRLIIEPATNSTVVYYLRTSARQTRFSRITYKKEFLFSINNVRLYSTPIFFIAVIFVVKRVFLEVLLRTYSKLRIIVRVLKIVSRRNTRRVKRIYGHFFHSLERVRNIEKIKKHLENVSELSISTAYWL